MRVWGHAPRKVEILNALKCVLETSEAPFLACIQYNHIPASCFLRLTVSESMIYDALASGLRSI